MYMSRATTVSYGEPARDRRGLRIAIADRTPTRLRQISPRIRSRDSWATDQEGLVSKSKSESRVSSLAIYGGDIGTVHRICLPV